MYADRDELLQPPIRILQRLVALAETESQLRAAVRRILVEAAPRHGGHADVLHQIPRELDVVAEAELTDVGHDVVRAERLIDGVVMLIEDVDEHVSPSLLVGS